MMVPRSFLFQVSPGARPKSSSPSSERKERKVIGVSPVKAIRTPNTTANPSLPTPSPNTSTPTEPVRIPSSSAPMLVQPRTHASSRRPSPSPHTQTVMARGQHGYRRHQSPDAHDASALPPAVAALLAVTAIPPPRGLARRRNQTNRKVTIDELVHEWRLEGTSPSSSESFRTPLDILLEPADDEDDDCLADIEDEKDSDLLSCRSVSSDSLASSAPSLDPSRSTASTCSNGPSTPSLRSRRSSAMKAERVASPPIERCDDHPLRPSSANDSDDTIVSHQFAQQFKETIKKKSSLKSNLTASLNALKSAAKSFSNFTATSIPADDMLARSLFSPRFASEMRPKDIDGLADPALRRYLNPVQGVQPPPLSLDDFSSQFQQALAQPADDEPAPMIQMQTYSRSRGRHSKSGKNDPAPVAEKAAMLAQILPAVRQREPRENSDFLRVVVLELNMRRIGKLDMKSPGRARVWLPPRKNNEVDPDRSRRKDTVPIRWRSTSAADFEKR
ncbi:hypothetical protein FKW77_006359 [Venturia effusa]|uniref:Uncharacterized protein n=1 Tax=Venturia effusa TaxID=50376 RepID=A0A517LP45_9PEZI|nr:hypothetical protein FKW77_006359 [Venturia effusa]